MSNSGRHQMHVEKIFGAHRIPYDPPMRGRSDAEFLLSEEREQADTMNMLSRAINVGRVIAFVGSGVSRNYGYPQWREMTKA
jgi:hypothetical protein